MVALLAAHPNQVSVNDVRNKINEILNEGIGGAVTTDPNPPTGTASDGDLWFDETSAILYVYTDSVNGWVQTNGGGGGGGTPGGADNEVQFNDNGSFAGSNKFTYDGGTVTVPRLSVSAGDNANEGGEIALEKSGNSTLNAGIILDMYIDSLRIFEGASPFRGAYLDLKECGNYLNGTQTNLLSGGGGGTPEIHSYYIKDSLTNGNGKISVSEFTEGINTTRSNSTRIDQAVGDGGTFKMFKSPSSGASLLEVDAVIQDRDPDSGDAFKLYLKSCTSESGVTKTSNGSVAMTTLTTGDTTGGSSTLGPHRSSRVKYQTILQPDTYFFLEIEQLNGGTSSATNATVKMTTYSGTGTRAYVTFDGTSSNLTSSIFNSFNVSSITDNNIGDYTINYQNQVPTPVVTAMVGEDITTQTDLANQNINLYDATNSWIRVRINQDSAGYSAGARDKAYVSVVVH